MTRLRAAIATAVVALVALPVPSAGAQSGVTVDPGSPSGKEYALPLDSARRDAASGSNDTGPAGAPSVTSAGQSSAPLFGEGVGASGPGTASKSAQRTARSGSGSKGQGAQAPGQTVDAAIAGARPVGAAVPAGGATSALTIGALALSVLLLGGVLGSIARRRQS